MTVDAAALARDGDHRVVLDVQLLLVADPVLALEDRGRRRRTPPSGSPRTDLVGREDVLRARADRRRPAAVRSARSGRAGAARAAWPGPAPPGAPVARRGAGSRPPSGTRIGWSALIELTTLSPGMSAAVTTTTFDQSNAGSRSSATNRACASVERIVAPNQAPGKTRSSVYLAAPVSLAGPSRRNGAAPRARPGHDRPGLDDDGVGRGGARGQDRARAILHGD